MTTTNESEDRVINPDLEKLVKLQKVDSELQRKRELLERLPAEIKEAYASCDEAKARLKEYDDTLEQDRKIRRELEQEVEEIKEKIAKDKQKLPLLKTNVEYRAMLKELENYDNKIASLEDEQLALMERDEKAEEGRKEYEVKVADEEKAFGEIKATKEAAIATVEGRVAELEEERAAIIGGVTPAIFKKYERVLEARNGVGVAEVKDQICQACNQKIQPQLYYNIRTTDELFSCPHCMRFLHWEGPTAEENDG